MSEQLQNAISKIEETYESIQTLVNKIHHLEKTVEDVSQKSKEFASKYESLIKGDELKGLKEGTDKSLKDAKEKLSEINDKLEHFANAKYLLNEELESTLRRVNKIDEAFNKNIKRMSDIDKKILNVSTKVDKIRYKSDTHLQKASSLYEIMSQAEDFKGLKRKVEDNNRLLRELLGRVK